MHDQAIRVPFFSIKWQAFSLMSVVLIGLVVLFLAKVVSSHIKQFESERSFVYQQNKQQLDHLIITSSDNMIQLGNTVTLNTEFTEAVFKQDTQRLDDFIEQLAWNFQLGAGIDSVSVYNPFGQLLSGKDSDFSSSLIKQILSSESTQWSVECSTTCSIRAGMPLLYEGKIMGVLLLSQPLSHVMLKFQEVSNINTGLLSANISSKEFNQFIPSWGKNLVALTNPKANTPVINSASKLFSLEELHNSGQLISLNNQVYELRAMSLEGRQMLVISDVSHDISAMKQYKIDVIKTSILALVVAETLVLIFLWLPLPHFKKIIVALPLLANKQYKYPRSTLKLSNSSDLFSDKSDSLQTRIRFHDQSLPLKKKALYHAETLFNTLLDNIDAIVITLDEDSCVVSSNKYLIQLLGLSSKSLKGKEFKELSKTLGGSKWLNERLQDVLNGILSEFQHESLMDSQSGVAVLLNWHHVPVYDAVTDSRQLLSMAIPIAIPPDLNRHI